MATFSSDGDCELAPTETRLKSRPWFCERPSSTDTANRTETDDLSQCLGAGHRLHNEKLCHNRWQWYQLNTEHPHEVSYYTLERVDGQLERVQRTRTQTLRHAVAFELETAFCPWGLCNEEGNREYYTHVDVLFVDGELQHPWDTDDPFPSNGGDWSGYYAGEAAGEGFRFFKSRKSVSFTAGFLNNGSNCRPALQPKVNIGVRCSWSNNRAALQGQGCRYQLSASLLPEMVYGGLHVRYPMAPAGEKGLDDARTGRQFSLNQPDAATHYFFAQLGEYDSISLSLTRDGANLTRVATNGQIISLGHGLRGRFFRRLGEGCPGAASTAHDREIEITGLTVTETLGQFCTNATNAGTISFAVAAADKFGPFPAPGSTNKEGMVGPEGVPLVADTRAAFKERTGYGAYWLKVEQQRYFEGSLDDGGSRQGCISYGQWREFRINAPGNEGLKVEIDADISAVYIRSGAPPTREVYDYRASASQRLLLASPCTTDASGIWHVAVSMGSSLESTGGLTPTTFSLRTTLQDHVIAPNGVIRPLDAGGRGYVCCGGWTHYRFAPLGESATLSASINVTSGAAKALFLKWGGCPTEADIDVSTGWCRGFCVLDWLSRSGAYSGTVYSSATAAVSIPHGVGEEPDKRRAGYWFLGIQAIGDEEAQFEVMTSVQDFQPPRGDLGCSRFTSFCNKDSERQAVVASDDLVGQDSSGVAGVLAARQIASELAARELQLLGAKYGGKDSLKALKERVVQPIVGILTVVVGVWLVRWAIRTWKRQRPLQVL